MRGHPGGRAVAERPARFGDRGDPLEAFAKVVDFERLRAELEAAVGYRDRAKDGRPPSGAVMMLEIPVIQAASNLSDDRADFRIDDRPSSMRFFGLGLADKAPGAKTIRIFRERVGKGGASGEAAPRGPGRALDARVVRDLEVVCEMPSRLVEEEDGVDVRRQRACEVLEEKAHRVRRDFRHHQCEGVIGARTHGTVDGGPSVAPVDEDGRAPPTLEPDPPVATLLPESRLVHEPRLDLWAGPRPDHLVYLVCQPPFLNALACVGSAPGWRERVFCQEGPGDFPSFSMPLSRSATPKSSFASRHGSSMRELDTPSRSGSGPRRIGALKAAFSASVSRAGRPLLGLSRSPSPPASS